MKNIHVLSTSRKSKLYRLCGCGNGKLYFDINSVDYYWKYNLYITSDEEIKPNQYYLHSGRVLFSSNDVLPFDDLGVFGINRNKKIILTTNQELIKHGVQAIDDEFLEWLVKNPSCEYVEVKRKKHFESDKSKRINPLNGFYYSYKIIIPQEEPKQELHTCKYCGIETAQPDDECYAKKMYSEEDLKEAFKVNYTPFSATNIGDFDKDWNKWFEQFKNKQQ
jgi:hypothetical protein